MFLKSKLNVTAFLCCHHAFGKTNFVLGRNCFLLVQCSGRCMSSFPVPVRAGRWAPPGPAPPTGKNLNMVTTKFILGQKYIWNPAGFFSNLYCPEIINPLHAWINFFHQKQMYLFHNPWTFKRTLPQTLCIFIVYKNISLHHSVF